MALYRVVLSVTTDDDSLNELDIKHLLTNDFDNIKEEKPPEFIDSPDVVIHVCDVEQYS